MQRLSERVTVCFPGLHQSERVGWTRAFIALFVEALSKTVEWERSLEKDLYRTRMKGMEGPTNSSQPSAQSEQIASTLSSELPDIDIGEGTRPETLKIGAAVDTAFGKGRVVRYRRECHNSSKGQKFLHLTVQEIALDFGGTLFRPETSTVTFRDNDEVAVGDTDTNPNMNASLDLALSHQPGMQYN
jgi:hypothetical protein